MMVTEEHWVNRCLLRTLGWPLASSQREKTMIKRLGSGSI